jgi:tetratricopeptide (TPR) repeat protein
MFQELFCSLSIAETGISVINRGLLIAGLLISLAGSAQSPLSTKSKKAIELYTQADNNRVRGQFPQALALLEEAIKKDKNFVEAYYRTGLVYMSMKNFTQALQFFEKGVELTSDIRKKKVFWFDMGEAYLNTGHYAELPAG